MVAVADQIMPEARHVIHRRPLHITRAEFPAEPFERYGRHHQQWAPRGTHGSLACVPELKARLSHQPADLHPEIIDEQQEFT